MDWSTDIDAERLVRALTTNAQWLRSAQVRDDELELPTQCSAAQVGDLVILSRQQLAEAVNGSEPDEMSGVSIPRLPNTQSAVRRRVGNVVSVAGFIGRTLIDGRGDASSRAAVRMTRDRFAPTPRKRREGRLGPQGGLVYRVEVDHSGRRVLRSWDHGGILDTNPNTETSAWPPQAMGMYYADAYAAAVFAELDEPEWRCAAVSALDHARRTYHRCPPSPIWYHHEFKNAPMMEAWLALDRPGGSAWIARLHGDNYDPLNVMSVRLHWLAVRSQLARQRGDKRRLRTTRERLLRCQQLSGLFRDDRPPAHTGVLDLSYHLFTLAFLSRFLAWQDDPGVEEAFLHGVDLASRVMLPDGSVALTGRGTNNVYQQAAAGLAFAEASSRSGTDSRKSLQAASFAAFELLLPHQDADGSWGTCLNRQRESRMAWNHCSTPYNALTDYFLMNALRSLPRSCPEVRWSGPRNPMGEFGRVTTQKLDLVFAAGYRGSVWSGRHGSGVAGPAGLTVGGGQVLLALDHLDDLDLQSTMLPQIPMAGGDVLDWRTPGSLSADGGAIRYRVESSAGTIEVVLRLRDHRLSVDVSAPVGCAPVFARLPLLKGVGCDTTRAPAAVRVDVPSNPRGIGDLWLWPVTMHSDRGTYSVSFARHGSGVIATLS